MALRLIILVGIGYSVDRHLIDSLLGPGTLPIQATITTTAGALLGLVRDIAGAALGAGDGRLRLPAPPVQRLDEDDQGTGPPGDA